MGKVMELHFNGVECAETQSTCEKLFDGCFGEGISEDLEKSYQWAETEIKKYGIKPDRINAMRLIDWFPQPDTTMAVFVNPKTEEVLYRMQKVDRGALYYYHTDDFPQAFVAGGDTIFHLILSGLSCKNEGFADKWLHPLLNSWKKWKDLMVGLKVFA